MRRTSDLPAFLAVYALLYAAFGVQSPFLPALLQERGLQAEEIGTVLAASTAIRLWPALWLVKPLIDRDGTHSHCAPARSPPP